MLSLTWVVASVLRVTRGVRERENKSDVILLRQITTMANKRTSMIWCLEDKLSQTLKRFTLAKNAIGYSVLCDVNCKGDGIGEGSIEFLLFPCAVQRG